MKLLKNIFIISTIVFFASCNDFLDVEVKSEFDDKKIFSDSALTERFVIDVYKLMAEDKAYRKNFDQYWYSNTDIERHNNTTSSTPFSADVSIFAYYVSDGNTAISRGVGDAVWKGLYRAIESCNVAILNIPKYSTPSADNKMGELYAEALAMRAYLYFDLIQYFGDVPARFEPVTSETVYLPISNRDEIYVQILSDLERAATYVDWGKNTSTKSIERASKEAILAFYSRVALSYVGFSQRPLGTPYTVLKSTGANSMVVRTVSDATKTEYLTKARNACEQILAYYGDDRLLTNYEDVFIRLTQNYINTTGSEYLWALNYRSYFQTMWAQPCTAGDFTPKTTQSKLRATPTFYFDFEPNDIRRDVTCPIFGLDIMSAKDSLEFFDITKIPFGKYRSQWMSPQFTADGDALKVPVIRYSDVYLMYAETCLPENLASDGAVMTGQAAFDKVRARAGLSSVPLTLANIQKERAFEFAAERIRRQDLIRWGILKEKLEETKTRSADLALFQGDYAGYSHIVTNNYKIYWRRSTSKETNTNLFKFEVYGLKTTETQNKLSTDPTGNWSDQLYYINSGVKANLDFFNSGGVSRITSIYINNAYNQSINPDEHQLVPIHKSLVESSRGTLYNSYGY